MIWKLPAVGRIGVITYTHGMRFTAFLLCVQILLVALTGCAPSSSNWYVSSGGPSPTDGMALQLELRDIDKTQYARFRVEPDGTLVYWGGKDVLFDKVTWTGSIDAKQGRELTALVRRESPLDSFSPAGDDAQPTWTLELAEHGRLVEHIVHGEVPCMRVLYDALQKYTSARFDAVVDALPRPDVEGLVVPRREADDNGDDGP